VDGTSAALGDTAPEFGARQTQDIAQCPQERHIGRNVDLTPFATGSQSSDARAFFKSDPIRSMQAEQLRNGIADASTSAVFSER
jgi:hypothetical protein